MSLICRLKGHKRSASMAWIDGAHVRSVCKRCGTQLVRIESKTWVDIESRMAHQFGF